MNKIAMLAILLLSGCTLDHTPDYNINRALYQQLFTQCMQNIPAGPRQTVSNDWDEVVNACDNAAYRQSRICIRKCDQHEVM